MAQVDAFRFLSNLQKLFAPSISDNQEFIAYIDGQSNKLIIQGDNIVHASSDGENINSEDVQQLLLEVSSASRQLNSIQIQTDNLENLCRQIPILQTQISTLSGNTEEGLPDFAWASIQEDIGNIKGDISDLSSTLESLESNFNSDNNNDAITSSDLDEIIEGLELKIEKMQDTIDALSLEIFGQATSETEYDIS